MPFFYNAIPENGKSLLLRDAGSTRKEVSKGNSCSADLEGSTRHNGGRELVLSFCSPEALLFKLTRLKLLVPKDT